MGPGSTGLPVCYSCPISECNTCGLSFPDPEPVCKECGPGLEFDSKTRSCIYSAKGSELGVQHSLSVAKYVLSTATATLVAVNGSTSANMIKTVQIFDYLGLSNVEIPANLQTVLEIFNENFLSFIPNPFFRENLED